MYEPINISLASSFNCIETYQKEIKAIDKAIEKTIRGMTPNALTILQSIPGIGLVWAAGMIAEIGSISAFHSSDALAKYAGLTWRRNDSGDFEAEDTPVTKAGNSYLRYYFGEAANSVRRHIPEYQAYYAKNMLKFLSISTREHSHLHLVNLYDSFLDCWPKTNCTPANNWTPNRIKSRTDVCFCV